MMFFTIHYDLNLRTYCWVHPLEMFKTTIPKTNPVFRVALSTLAAELNDTVIGRLQEHYNMILITCKGLLITVVYHIVSFSTLETYVKGETSSSYLPHFVNYTCILFIAAFPYILADP